MPQRPEGLEANRPLDGSDPSLVWTEMVPWEDLRVRKPDIGFVQNCNNGPEFTTELEDPVPSAFPPGPPVASVTRCGWYLRQLLHG